MIVYIVVENWSCDNEFGDDFEVFDTKEKALKYFQSRVDDTKMNYHYDTIEEEDESFNAYDNGEYLYSHTDIYIREREVK